jgi:hypothetical protein
MVERLGKHSTRWRGTVLPNYGPKYTGFWRKLPEPNPNCFESTGHLARSPGAKVECKFRGASIRVVGLKSYDYGYANVYLDGTQVVTNFDCYSSNMVCDVTYFERSGLVDGDHTITVEAVGGLTRAHHPSSSDYYICLDQFVVDGVPLDDAGLPYTFFANPAAGARLWVDNVPVMAPVKLERRQHRLQLNAGSADVTLGWSSPLDAPQTIPRSALFPVATGAPNQEP